jgi:predicted DNA-binding transcriptional regulator AlpA
VSDSDPLLSLLQMAELAGIRPGTLRKYRSEGRLPAPDNTDVPGRPRWRRSTFDAWMATRPGRGARTDLHGG